MFVVKENKILFLSIIGAIVIAFIYYAIFFAPAKIRITEIDYKSNLPANYPILRIVAISDIYAGSFHINEQKLEEIVTHINLLNPDIVLLLGNYINSWSVLGHYINPNKISENLARINSTYGTYAVFGKDDVFRGKNVSEMAFKRNNIKTFDDKSITLDVGGKNPLTLIGIDDNIDLKTIDEISKNIPNPYIILANNPNHIENLAKETKEKAVLSIAGYTRGGQIDIPTMRPFLLPDDIKNYVYGKYKIGEDSLLYVTSGIGTKTYPIRINTEPEIVFINLYSANIE